MRHLRTHLSSRAWRRLSGATILLVCGLLAVVAFRTRASSVIGAVFGAETSEAAAQAPETFIQQSRRALARGQLAQAEELAKTRPAGDPEAAAVLAQVESSRGRYDEARRLLEAAVAVNPSGEAALELGLLLQHQFGRDDVAAEHFNRVIGTRCAGRRSGGSFPRRPCGARARPHEGCRGPVPRDRAERMIPPSRPRGPRCRSRPTMRPKR